MAVRRISGVSLVSREAAGTARFYTDMLGLQVDTGSSREGGSAAHSITFANGDGARITIREEPDAPNGKIGIGTVHHVALTVATFDGLLKWKRWLQERDVLVYGPYDQQAYSDIVFADPNGVLLEISTSGPGWEATHDGRDVFLPPKESIAPFRDEHAISARRWAKPVTAIDSAMELQGLHHISTIVSSLEQTDRFYRDVLGMDLVRKTLDHDDPEVQHWYCGARGGQPGTVISAFPIVHAEEGGKPIYGKPGVGVVDRFALEMDAGPPASLKTPDGELIDLVPADRPA